MVLGATNRPSELDEAILRRFSQAFEIGMPDRSERAKILEVILKGEKVEDGIDFDYIASMCEGYTGSDLLELCKKAAYFPIRELLDGEKKGKKLSVSVDNLLLVLLLHFLHINCSSKICLELSFPCKGQSSNNDEVTGIIGLQLNYCFM